MLKSNKRKLLFRAALQLRPSRPDADRVIDTVVRKLCFLYVIRLRFSVIVRYEDFRSTAKITINFVLDLSKLMQLKIFGFNYGYIRGKV